MKHLELNKFKFETVTTEIFPTGIINNYPDGFILGADDHIVLFNDGELKIYPGYKWDGASGAVFQTKPMRIASLPHDALYLLMRAGKLDRSHRKEVDDLFHRLCIANGMWKFRADYAYAAIRKLGENNVYPKKELGKIVEYTDVVY